MERPVEKRTPVSAVAFGPDSTGILVKTTIDIHIPNATMGATCPSPISRLQKDESMDRDRDTFLKLYTTMVSIRIFGERGIPETENSSYPTHYTIRPSKMP